MNANTAEAADELSLLLPGRFESLIGLLPGVGAGHRTEPLEGFGAASDEIAAPLFRNFTIIAATKNFVIARLFFPPIRESLHRFI